MSIFSEKLAGIVNKKGLSAAQLAKKCDIDRSTIFQYIKGKRPLLNSRHRDILFSQLRLTPDEKDELNRAYAVTQMGERTFLRSCMVRDIIAGLTDPELIPMPSAPGNFNGQIQPGSFFLRGELSVSRAITNVVEKALEGDVPLYLLVQPDYTFLNDLLLIHGRKASSGKITQILCLKTNTDDDPCVNLELLRRVLQMALALPGYTPLYYYGIPSEHFGLMNVLPNLLLTQDEVLQFSTDKKSALLHTGKDAAGPFLRLFKRMEASCGVLISSLRDPSEIYPRIFCAPQISPEKDTFELASGIDSLPFWTEELFGYYIKKPKLARALSHAAGQLYASRRNGHTTFFVNPETVELFIRTGCLNDIPDGIINGPLEAAHRKVILDRLLKACMEGWCHILFISPEECPTGGGWQIISRHGADLILHFSSPEQSLLFKIGECDIRDAFHDYFENRSRHGAADCVPDAVDQIRMWMQQYL